MAASAARRNAIAEAIVEKESRSAVVAEVPA